MEAWRHQQVAALTQAQRQIYDQARRKSGERTEAKQKELAERRQSDVQERTRRNLLQAPSYDLKPAFRRIEMTEIVARRVVAQYFEDGALPPSPLYAMVVRQAADTARREIEHEHRQELEALKAAERGGHDEMLRSFAAAREAPPVQREPFARAAAEGHAKTDFEKAATNADTNSPAIARAIERVRRKEEEQRRDRDRERDPGRER